ncbi:MAG TPA: beta-propeller fold lactonase family protein [Terriglobales bacterium]|nr:beta-propeller fold lactonase family protein [Terriglobales bacterium]
MALLTACGGSGHASASFAPSPTPTPTPGSPVPSPTASPTPSPTPAPTPLAASRFVYAIIDFEADGYFGGSINSTTGAVSLIPGSPFNNALGQNIVLQVLSDPQGRFLYSLNLGASSFGIQFGQIGIGAYTINQSSGAIAPSPTQIIFPAVRDAEMAIDASGHFLYQPDSGTIDTYSIDQTTGALTLLPAQPAAVPVGNFSAASPDGRFIVNEGNGLIEAFSINTATGQLTLAAPPIPTGGSGGPMTISADSRFIYVANTNESTVEVFNIGPAGVLAPTLGSPFAVDAKSAGITLSPDGRFLYLAFGSPDTGHVKGWAVNPDTGNFAPIAGASLSNANTINVDHSGLFAYVSQQKLVTYKVDPATGALTQVSQAAQPWSDAPDNVALIP